MKILFLQQDAVDRRKSISEYISKNPGGQSYYWSGTYDVDPFEGVHFIRVSEEQELIACGVDADSIVFLSDTDVDVRDDLFVAMLSSGSMPFSVELDITGNGGQVRCIWA